MQGEGLTANNYPGVIITPVIKSSAWDKTVRSGQTDMVRGRTMVCLVPPYQNKSTRIYIEIDPDTLPEVLKIPRPNSQDEDGDD